MRGCRNRATLKAILDRLYATYDLRYLHTSALQLPRRYHRPEDVEVVGFIASCFAYGRVAGFTAAITTILEALGPHPYHGLLRFDPRRPPAGLRRFRYRFTTAADARNLLWRLRLVLERYRSLQTCFLSHYSDRHEDSRTALAAFVEEFDRSDRHYRKDRCSAGMRHLLPSPARGGACKRLHLFLRWMVRRDHIDLGLWRDIPPAKLIIPLDTHVARVARGLGLTRLKSPGLPMALDITSALKQFDPEDPVKYDFALCRWGMRQKGAGFMVESLVSEH
jgi:uncharacterized protein (TIGR02757 family)